MGGEPNPRDTPDLAEDRTLSDNDGWPVPPQPYLVEVDSPAEAAPPEHPAARRFPPDIGPGLLAALVGVLLLVLLIPAAIWLSQRGDDAAQPTSNPMQPPATRTVPDVVGLTLPEARDQVRESGLDVRVRRVASDQPQDVVVRQRPAADADAPPDGFVVLTVSDGPSGVVLPRVEGLTLDEATQTLENAGLRVDVRRVESPEPEGTVVGQTPSAGDEVERETVVVLEVARPAADTTTDTTTSATTTTPEPATVAVPDLVGLTASEARSRLSDLGLRYTQRPLTDSRPKGTVIRQSPGAGAELREGGRVTLTVSTGPATIAIPDVVGLDEASARQELQAAGFRVDVVEAPTADPAEDGVVLDQDPSGGASRPGDSVVTLTVGLLS
jgi:eukaryotic-like serine/threonine-protein kinase